MPIPFTCPNCGRTGRLPDTFTATHAKCPACQAQTPISRPGIETIPLKEEDAVPLPRRMAPPVMTADRSARSEDDGVVFEPSKRPVALIAGGVGGCLVIVAGIVIALTRGGTPAPAPKQVSEAANTKASERRSDQADRGTVVQVPAPPHAGIQRTGVAASKNGPAPTSEPAAASPAPPFGALAAAAGEPRVTNTGVNAGATPAETVEHIKDATVFLNVRAGRLRGAGPGSSSG
jgi:hypothetical protein